MTKLLTWNYVELVESLKSLKLCYTMVHLYNLSCARCTQRSLAWRWIHCKLWPLLPWQSREKCMAPGGAGGGPSATAEPRICTAAFLLLFWLKVLKMLKKYMLWAEKWGEHEMRGIFFGIAGPISELRNARWVASFWALAIQRVLFIARWVASCQVSIAHSVKHAMWFMCFCIFMMSICLHRSCFL